MHKSTLAIATGTLALLLSSALCAQSEGTSPPPGAPAGAPTDAPPGPRGPRGGARAGQQAMTFGAGMKQAGRAFKALKASSFDASSRAADLEALQMLESGLIASKGQIASVPMSPNAEKKFGSDTSAYHAAFRRDLLAALTQALATERAVVDGDTGAATKAFAMLGKDQETGHTLFQDEEQEEEPKGTAPRGGAR